ncbi:MAG: hypothetical protein C4555_01320 [Dehalococcoidia bacterium]|nr:MAG: hypothetical protein C4555_01320 [Dehalococcoidia bacterium]
MEGKTVVVYRAAGEMEAGVITGLLASHGIPSALKYEALSPLLGGTGEYQVIVPKDLAETALELIETDGTV